MPTSKRLPEIFREPSTARRTRPPWSRFYNPSGSLDISFQTNPSVENNDPGSISNGGVTQITDYAAQPPLDVSTQSNDFPSYTDGFRVPAVFHNPAYQTTRATWNLDSIPEGGLPTTWRPFIQIPSRDLNTPPSSYIDIGADPIEPNQNGNPSLTDASSRTDYRFPSGVLDELESPVFSPAPAPRAQIQPPGIVQRIDRARAELRKFERYNTRAPYQVDPSIHRPLDYVPPDSGPPRSNYESASNSDLSESSQDNGEASQDGYWGSGSQSNYYQTAPDPRRNAPYGPQVRPEEGPDCPENPRVPRIAANDTLVS